ncbi:hypothetical protein L596_006848 [Steinernema carpocapsae]|uniref:Uncharacterized protein n=1 Tax=Steinernema carpocapsae TaxID=34508 RepID=A0A4U5P781_STECR|nr:hypothetical protein L596_006848 [Steinernema carpocapsae]
MALQDSKISEFLKKTLAIVLSAKSHFIEIFTFFGWFAFSVSILPVFILIYIYLYAYSLLTYTPNTNLNLVLCASKTTYAELPSTISRTSQPDSMEIRRESLFVLKMPLENKLIWNAF